ncbi:MULTISPECIES: hypothetical protein [Kribbella]|uniref:hypothetical protein n=1 Tax=Kribbella TaxID=182639 RepID=UPI0018EE7DC1|nr:MULTISPECIES: hypothetical protein [Kribbella]
MGQRSGLVSGASSSVCGRVPVGVQAHDREVDALQRGLLVGEVTAGVRIEELLELTQLSLRHYTSQTTGTLVALLHNVRSKRTPNA